MTKLTKVGLLLLIIGIASMVIQNTFYGYMDAEGVIHDSLFLPIGACSVLLSLIVFVVSGVTYAIHKYSH